MEGVSVNFQSAILQTDIVFGRTKHDSKMATFVLKKGNDVYRCTLFEDDKSKVPFEKMHSLATAGKLKKGTVLNVEAEMTMFSRSLLDDIMWASILNNLPPEHREGVPEINPTLAKFPQFRVRDWDFALPKEYYEANKKKYEEEKAKPQAVKPLTGKSFQTGGRIA